MLKTFLQVFSKKRYILLALTIALCVVTAILWYQNWSLIIYLVFAEGGPILGKLTFIVSLYGALATNFSHWSAFYTVFISLLFGIQISLLVYYWRRVKIGRSHLGSLSTSSLLGLLTGLLGVGCAACGSIILTAILGTVGAGSLLLFLPLHGEEFILLGIIVLLTSIYYLLKKIDKPLVC